MNLPVSILVSMIKIDRRLFRFALLFPDFARNQKLRDQIIDSLTVVTFWQESALVYRVFGRKHRADGPAVIRRNKKPETACIPLDCSKPFEMEYWFHGRKHRLDGPARVSRGKRRQEWWVNGRLHRENDLPAYIDDNLKCWYENGKLHRTDAPAYIRDGDIKLASITIGRSQITAWYDRGRMHRVDGPAYLSISMDLWGAFSERTEQWRIYGRLHRRDGPAQICTCLETEQSEWYENGKLHRLDGPAIIIKKNGVVTQMKWYYRGRLLPYRFAPIQKPQLNISAGTIIASMMINRIFGLDPNSNSYLRYKN